MSQNTEFGRYQIGKVIMVRVVVMSINKNKQKDCAIAAKSNEALQPVTNLVWSIDIRFVSNHSKPLIALGSIRCR
jgi:hypothetical protein